MLLSPPFSPLLLPRADIEEHRRDGPAPAVATVVAESEDLLLPLQDTFPLDTLPLDTEPSKTKPLPQPKRPTALPRSSSTSSTSRPVDLKNKPLFTPSSQPLRPPKRATMRPTMTTSTTKAAPTASSKSNVAPRPAEPSRPTVTVSVSKTPKQPQAPPSVPVRRTQSLFQQDEVVSCQLLSLIVWLIDSI